jgi:hypothetical protein
MKRNLYDVELAQKLTEKLRALPSVAPAKRKATKQEIVKMLVGEIDNLLERGYSLDQVAESISGDGFDITGPVLKSYLSRIKAETEGTAKHARRGKKRTAKKQPGTTVQAQEKPYENKSAPTEVAKSAAAAGAAKSQTGKNKMHVMDDNEAK